VFLDSSPTAYAIARRIVHDGHAATLLTNSQPVMKLVAVSGDRSAQLIGVGGTLRRDSRAFVGPVAVQAVCEHFADWLFLSASVSPADGTLGERDPLEAEVKQAMLTQADKPVLLVDASDLRTPGPIAIGHVAQLVAVIAHGVPATGLAALRAAGATVRAIGRPDPSAESTSVGS
jgi:DeoR/GlpR family transcriptional regulator of sugar metabolism